jgi:prepilin-type N-terminal cleavage/methylation domain-containing protein
MRPADQMGFTLIEVLVALVVSSLLLAVIFQGSSLAVTRLRASAERREALIDGRYLLTRVAVDDYVGGARGGATPRLAWQSQETLVRTDQRHLIGLIQLHVLVRGKSGATVFDQSTLRLKALPQR